MEDKDMVNAVSVKLPPLTLKNPAQWFRRAEAKFRLSGIKCQVTMADHALSVMTEDVLDRLDPWMYKQDTALEYGTLKAYIMKRFSHSPSERAQRILSLAGQPLRDSTVEEAWSEVEALAKLSTKDGVLPKRISLKREILLVRLQNRRQIPDARY
jgi:hypothetical protein